MDPVTIALSVGLVVGAAAFDTRGMDYLQQRLGERLRQQALEENIRVEQPTEPFRFDEKTK